MQSLGVWSEVLRRFAGLSRLLLDEVIRKQTSIRGPIPPFRTYLPKAWVPLKRPKGPRTHIIGLLGPKNYDIMVFGP